MKYHHSALTALLIGAALPSSAEVFTINGETSKVTLHPNGAMIEVVADVDIPAGDHEIYVQGLSAFDGLETPLLSAGSDLQIVSSAIAHDFGYSAVVGGQDAELNARIDAARDAVLQHNLEAAEPLARLDAANQVIAYLQSLRGQDETTGLTTNSEDALAMIGVITAEMQKAKLAQAQAEIDWEHALRGQDELQKQLDLLLSQKDEEHEIWLEAMRFEVKAGEAYQGQLTFQYMTQQMSWEPRYEVRLDQEGSRGTVNWTRGASIYKSFVSDWSNVQLAFSTSYLNPQMLDYELNEAPLTILDEKSFANEVNFEGSQDAEPALEELTQARSALNSPNKQIAASGVERTMMGQNIEYTLETSTDLSDAVEGMRVQLANANFDVNLYARATPRHDDGVFLYSDFINDLGPLPRGYAEVHRDGVRIGEIEMPFVADGEEMSMAFGPLNGIQVQRIVEDAQAGEGGFLSAKGEWNEEVKIDVTSLLDYELPIEIIDRVPYSEDEKIVVNYQATPAPDETDWDGRRGILLWRLNIPAGAQAEIKLSNEIRWPENESIMGDIR